MGGYAYIRLMYGLCGVGGEGGRAEIRFTGYARLITYGEID